MKPPNHDNPHQGDPLIYRTNERKKNLMQILKSILIAGAILLLHPTALVKAATIDGPTDEQIVSLYHFLAGDPPNFEQDARNDYEYAQANEFDKPAVLQRIMRQKQALYEGNAAIDLIIVRTQSRITEYNSDIGGFQFEIFRPGSYFPFHGNGQYGLTLENAEDFRNWIIPVSEARIIREKTPMGNLNFEIGIRPFTIAATRDKHIRGQVVSVKAFASKGNMLVYETKLDPSEYRPIAGADSPVSEVALETEKISIQGNQIGMQRAEFEAWLNSNRYLVRAGAREISFGTNRESIDLHNAGGDLASTGSTDYDPIHMGVFGIDFDCRSVDDTLHSCGKAVFDESGLLSSLVLMQSALGVTKQQIVASLNSAYGSPTDRMNVSVMTTRRGEQLVWGLSSTSMHGQTAESLTEISGPKHWQVEAVITEPSTKRMVVFVQINRIEPSPVSGTAGGGQMKF